ncbi:Hypothetical protein, putative [Bodo saltans]|uniref:Uncharacterized protein n=1 Tax=Bodo saltans TaxID=75058 RepID=A0A0S4ISC8_BODSA|nr:Hypothetical protein, putative [Bodo saltans]|eukprot:CUF53261.1 Hypothetical protein, putative [Bodo saltans]
MCESYVFSRLDEVASSGAATPVARRGGMMGAAVKTDVELVAPSPMMFADNQSAALLDMAATHDDDDDDDDDEEEDTSLCASASYRRLRSITLSLGGDTPMLRSGNGGQRLLDYEISNDDDDDDVEKSDSAEVAVVDNNSNNSAVTATRHYHTAHTQNEDEEATNSNHVALAEDDDGVALTSGRTLGGLRAAAERHEFVAPAAAAAAVVAPSLEALRFVAAFRESVDKSRSSIMARLSTSSNTSTLSALSFAAAGDRHSVLLIPEPSQDALDSVNVNHSDWTDDHLSKNEESVVQFGAPTPISASSSINLSWMMLPEGGAAEGGDDDRSVLKREREVADEEEDERADEEDTDLASRGPSSRRASVSPRSQNHRQPRPRAVPADQRRLEGHTKGVTPFSRQRAVPPPTPPLPRSNPVGSAAAVHRNTTADASSLHAPSPPPLLAPPPRATLTTRASSIMQGQLSDTPKLRLSKDAVEKLLSIFTQEGEGGRVWQRLRAAVKQHASTETGPHTSTSSSSSSSAAAADKDLKIELRILAQVLLSFVRVANGSSTFAKQRMSAGDVFRGLVALYVERMQKCRSLTTNCTSNGSRTRSSLPNSLQSSRAPSPSISSQAPPLSQRSDDDDAAVMTGTGTVRDLICAAVGGSSLLAAPSPFVVFVERRAPAPYTHHHHHDESDTTSTPPAGGTAGGGTGNSSVAATLKHLSKKLTAARGTTTTSLARPSTAFGSSSTRTAFASSSVSSSSALSSTWTTVPVHFAEYDFHSKSLCDVGKFWEALRKLRRAELMLNAASSGPVLGQ